VELIREAGTRYVRRALRRRGAYVGLSLAHRCEHLYRAVLESVAFGGRQVLEALLDTGVGCSEIIIAGGGSRRQLWTQIHADVLGVPVIPLAQADQVALAAAMCAAVGNRSFTGLRQAASAMSQLAQPVAPIPANEEAYKAQFMVYQRAKRSTRRHPASTLNPCCKSTSSLRLAASLAVVFRCSLVRTR